MAATTMQTGDGNWQFNAQDMRFVAQDNATLIVGDIPGGSGHLIKPKAVEFCADVGSYSFRSLRQTAKYVRRAALHDRLKSYLHDPPDEDNFSSRIVIVWGLGGVGKTQLVLFYIKVFRKDYAAVFWIDADSKVSLERDFSALLGLLTGKPPDTIKLEDAVSKVKRFFGQSNERWLLVLDNADSIDDPRHPDYVDLSHICPDEPTVDIIITTRSNTALGMYHVGTIHVQEMSADESVQLLLKSSNVTSSEANMTAAAEVAEELGYLALALALAGAYVAETPRLGQSFAAYLQEYHQRRADLLSRQPSRLVNRYDQSVLTTWETSYQAIITECPTAVQIFDFLSYLSPSDLYNHLFGLILSSANSTWEQVMRYRRISEAMLKEGLQGELDRIFAVLTRYSMLSWTTDQQSYKMHKLVHAWGYERMDLATQQSHATSALDQITRLTKLQNKLFDYSTAERTRAIPHVAAIVNKFIALHGATSSVREADLINLDYLGTYLASRGQYGIELDLRYFELSAWEALKASESEEVLRAKHNLARAVGQTGHLEEAEALQEDVLRIRRSSIPVSPEKLLTAMNNLVVTYVLRRRYDEAESLGMEALSTASLLKGEQHPDVLISKLNLAGICTARGNLAEAERLLKEIIDPLSRALTPTHRDVLICQSNLGMVYGARGKYDEALIMLRKVIDLSINVLGTEHPATLNSKHNLAVILWQRKTDTEDRVDAIRIMREVLQGRRKIFGSKHDKPLDDYTDEELFQFDLQGSHRMQEYLIEDKDFGITADSVDVSSDMLRRDASPLLEYNCRLWLEHEQDEPLLGDPQPHSSGAPSYFNSFFGGVASNCAPVPISKPFVDGGLLSNCAPIPMSSRFVARDAGVQHSNSIPLRWSMRTLNASPDRVYRFQGSTSRPVRTQGHHNFNYMPFRAPERDAFFGQPPSAAGSGEHQDDDDVIT